MSRNNTIDFAKILFAFFIYFLHADFAQYATNDIFYSILKNGVFRTAVPFFFIVSGYYFFNNVNNADRLCEWSKSVILIYLSWMVVYLPFYYKQSIFTYLFGYWHLWYLTALLLGGVMLYFIKDNKYGLFFSISIAVVGVVIQYFRSMADLNLLPLSHLITHDFFTRNFLFFAFPYLYFGWYINKYEIENKINEKIIIPMVFLGFLFVAFESALQPTFTVYSEFSRDLLFSNLIFIPVLFVFCLKKNITINFENKKFLRDISTLIFLIHPLAIIISNEINFSHGRVLLQVVIIILLIPIVYKLKKHLKFIF